MENVQFPLIAIKKKNGIGKWYGAKIRLRQQMIFVQEKV
jgi:hypothetical protein